MRALLQRVRHAQVEVDGQRVGEIGPGWLILLGVGHGDTQATADQLAEKIALLRCFEDANGKTNLSILDVGGEVLLVSQFTLYADLSRGRRPGFTNAAARRGKRAGRLLRSGAARARTEGRAGTVRSAHAGEPRQ